VSKQEKPSITSLKSNNIQNWPALAPDNIPSQVGKTRKGLFYEVITAKKLDRHP